MSDTLLLSAGEKCYACIVSGEEKPELASALEVCPRLSSAHTEAYSGNWELACTDKALDWHC